MCKAPLDFFIYVIIKKFALTTHGESEKHGESSRLRWEWEKQNMYHDSLGISTEAIVRETCQ